jgi:hypothetical protein
MKKYLLLLLFILSVSTSFCQELYLGKSYSEICNIANGSKVLISINGKKAIKEIVDTNVVDIYIFNPEDFCIEYDRIYINSDIEQVNKYLQDFFKVGDIYEDNTKGLVAMVQSISDNTHRIRFMKKLNIY